MKGKRVVRLADNRSCTGGSVRALRTALRGIGENELVGVGLVTIQRDGTVYTYARFDDPIRGLGACELLRESVVVNHFKREASS